MTKRWKPKVGERYWVIVNNLVSFKITCENDVMDRFFYSRNNVFRTRTLAEKALRQVRKVLREAEHE